MDVILMFGAMLTLLAWPATILLDRIAPERPGPAPAVIPAGFFSTSGAVVIPGPADR